MVRVKNVDGAEIWEPLRRLAERPEGEPVSADEIAGHIEQLIVTACLTEGTRLPSERDLVQLTGTSRPTVSQAIRILVVKGLVESRRGSGAYVRRKPEFSLAASVDLMLNLNQQSVGQLADLRLWLETVGITRAIEVGSEDEVAAGERALEEMIANAGDTAAWMSADTHFHATLVRAGHNPYLSSIYESIHETLINYEYRSWISDGTVPKWLQPAAINGIVALHTPILDAVRNRDEEAGRIAVLHHHYVMAQHLQLASRD
ncbi:GntR family transcriptional repressor for pyruvate dehydrogenase complex [Propionibacteriaceae bacterium ES.041]|uniref:FadR/GntR family transcriptional regulator n=1 Tax=Enemella evansiae TaxID=2016499 RepID=UPI000B95F8C5|nr:FadR/GntR family transcriptional regulator [Enemella evansiae]OYN95746.1 GntR family transcriptional regulator [Enemella evansiae]PFG68058.1 GntR family transcriptional repressor for pyruvate dehydrogenase complex [Propionibacteriaceae bacterium ES.041]